ncbi:radical SAM/SPASM domain-containing protein [Nostoc sp. FACHB-145]|uniref:radical SAM/SPASM domain-containing protein n=1 Tax=Nostoc sp. FACHB-145 TaxID=2692836 RepID=UPI0016868627|nr:radical SAM protein [Nostoc sp. FACHB-145]MBD2470937.1 radical SAM protein [Nostoc sp. FACHB-145]
MTRWKELFNTPDASGRLSVILKLVGEVCNIDCNYCYEKRKPKTSGRVLEASEVKNLLDYLGSRPLAVELHGGEPLLAGRERVADILNVLQDHSSSVSVKVMTNGLLLDDEWFKLFSNTKLNVQIGISLDGSPEHNLYRLDFFGKATSSVVERSLHVAHQLGIDIGVLCVVHQRNVYDPEGVLRYFTQFPAIKTVKFAPCFDYKVEQHSTVKRSDLTLSLFPSNGNPEWSISPHEFSTFLNKSFDVWCKEDYISSFLLEPQTSLLRSIFGQIPADCHTSPRKCSYVITLYPGGKITSCDELPSPFSNYTDSTYETTLIEKTLTFEENSYSLTEWVKQLLQKCNDCEYHHVCRGGCVAARQRLKSVGKDEEYCQYRISVIEHLRVRIFETTLSFHNSGG